MLICCPGAYKGDLIIPEGVTKIYGERTYGNGAFAGCIGLTGVTIPNSMNVIGDGAFSGCVSLTEVTIPKSVNLIGRDTFSGCSALKSVTLPKKIISLGARAFSDCSSLESISLPTGITSIQAGTFRNCSSLKNIIIPEGIKSIHWWAFYKCVKLEEAQIPNSVTSIETEAFFDCNNINKISIPTKLQSVGSYAFGNCSRLKSLTIPDTVKKIGFRAFSGCDKLKDIYYNGDDEQWNALENIDLALDGCNAKVHFKKIIPKMTLNTSSLTLKTGTTRTVTATLVNDSISKVTSSDKTKSIVASAKKKGKGIVIKAGNMTGKATVTVKSKSGILRKITVNVQTAMVTTKEIQLSKTEVSLDKKEKSAVITVKAKPDEVSTGEPIEVWGQSIGRVFSYDWDSKTGKITITGKDELKRTGELTVAVGRKRKRITVKVNTLR